MIQKNWYEIAWESDLNIIWPANLLAACLENHTRRQGKACPVLLGNRDTTTRAHERGAAILRDSTIRALDGYILVPLNCGQELYDVVDITDPVAGLSASKRRVLSLGHIYNTQKGWYTLKIGLGGV